MNRKVFFLLIAAALSCSLILGDETGSTAPSRRITLQEAVQLALKHNHNVRIAGYAVDEKQHSKEAAKGSYYPSIRNESSFLHLTDANIQWRGARAAYCFKFAFLEKAEEIGLKFQRHVSDSIQE